MIKILSRFPASIAMTVLAALVLILGFLGHMGLWEVLRDFDKYRVDEFIIPAFLIGVGLLSDFRLMQMRNQSEIRKQRLSVLQATMRTVQDIMNNFLNNLQIFEMEAERALSEESRALFQSLIHETAGKLKRLGALTETPEKRMASGVGIDYESRPAVTVG